MKYGKKPIAILLLTLMLTTLCASCSNKGVQMPKHRMRRHCNCPTFSQVSIIYSDAQTFRCSDSDSIIL